MLEKNYIICSINFHEIMYPSDLHGVKKRGIWPQLLWVHCPCQKASCEHSPLSHLSVEYMEFLRSKLHKIGQWATIDTFSGNILLLIS